MTFLRFICLSLSSNWCLWQVLMEFATLSSLQHNGMHSRDHLQLTGCLIPAKVMSSECRALDLQTDFGSNCCFCVPQGDTIPYVICTQQEAAVGGPTKSGLADRAYHPEEMNPSAVIDVEYYLAHQVNSSPVYLVCSYFPFNPQYSVSDALFDPLASSQNKEAVVTVR